MPARTWAYNYTITAFLNITRIIPDGDTLAIVFNGHTQLLVQFARYAPAIARL